MANLSNIPVTFRKILGLPQGSKPKSSTPSSTNFRRTANWLKACGKTPNPKDLDVQIGCHLEELAEFLDELRIVGSASDEEAITLASTHIKGVAHRLKQRRVGVMLASRVGALDALCDAEVTGNGVAYLARMDKEEADRRVLRSNDSKLNKDGTAVILPGGKIGKGPDYLPPFLDDLV